MVRTRQAVGFVAFVLGAAALTAVNHHPNHGRRTERERAGVEAAADRLTHWQIAVAWTQTKLGNAQPLQEIKQTFPLPVRTVHEDSVGIVFTFQGHNSTCIDFVSQPASSLVTSRHC